MNTTITPESAEVCGQSANSADNMRTRPTPDTDAFILGSITKTDWNWRHFARQLERERDTARYLFQISERARASLNEALDKVLADNTAMREAIREAHKIIQVLYMDALDHHKESWPRANEWMEKYAAFAKP